MTEVLYRFLARFFRRLGAFFNDRADLLCSARMYREFPFACRVRIVCDCDDRIEDHQGEWYIFDYKPDAGDFRVMREIPPPGTNIFSNMYRYVRPEQLQRVS